MAKKDLQLLLFIALGILGIAFISSCETKDPECYQPVNVTAISGFMVRDTVLVIDTIPGTGVPIDTYKLVYNNKLLISPGMFTLDVDSFIGIIGSADGANQLSVPLNPNADSMRYRLVLDTSQVAQADTVTFYYTSSVHFISNSCGYTNYYNLDSVHSTKNFLDSIALVNPAVTNDQTAQARHILIYFFE